MALLSPATSLCALALAALACAPTTPPPLAGEPAAPASSGRRAILLSIDSFNEERILSSIDRASIPAIAGLFSEGACAAWARPAFPSFTAPGHAALWTGAYGDVSGIAGNWQPPLPRDQHALTDGISGYLPASLRAEPLWILAGASGIPVAAHHVTQAPAPPAYPPVAGARDPALTARHARAAATLQRPNVRVMNGYNRKYAVDTLITERAAAPRPANGWANAGRLTAGRPPLEIAWRAGPDSLFALLHGATAYTHATIATTRDAARGVTVAAAPVERTPPDAARLARHFSDALAIAADDSTTLWTRFRLFALAPDGSSFQLFQPAIHHVDANRSDVAAGYSSAVRGWVGNGPYRLLENGGLGPTLEQGGDGTAEAMYLEALENVTRRFMEGSAWAWRSGVRLLFDYFPVGDEIDHPLYGIVAPSLPDEAYAGIEHRDALRQKVAELRRRGWMLVDIRLAHLRRLVGDDRNAALFVSGDHGMRPTWKLFKPNVALMNVGLLGVDSAWKIDLPRTHAISPNGYWVSINTTDWKGGIVPPEQKAGVLAAAERALRLARAPDGSPIVTRTFRATEHDSLGLGGPSGGDLYFDLAPGYYFSSAVTGAMVVPKSLGADHGFPSIAPEMRTVLCASGKAFAPRRAGPARIIDAAPTVSEWLGIAPPLDARGRSVLEELLVGGR